MEISISKKSIILVSTLFFISLFIIMTICLYPSTDNSIYYGNKISDHSLNEKISNNDIPTLLTNDIFGNPKNDFKPGEIVYIHGSNFNPEFQVELNITRPNDVLDIAPGGRFGSNLLPFTNQNGDFYFYEYDLNGIEGEYLIQTTDSINYAQVIFYDSSIWTTDGLAQQKNNFSSGELVGLNGSGLTPNAYLYYEIEDKPSGGDIVSWGWINTDNNGDINFSIIWDIPISYSKTGQHKVSVNDTQNKTKTFRIDASPCTDLDGDGWTTCEGDCDDNDASIWQILEGYIDKDNDDFGYGDIITICSANELPEGYSSNNDDCDDNDNTIYPGAPELCDGKDNNCDDLIDEDFTYFFDSDNDNYGDPLNSIVNCTEQPEDYVSDNTDCNDSDDTIYPGAPELLDGKDNDCDGETDEVLNLYVDDNANPIWYDFNHVRTIQEAINNASIGAEIFVNNGTYLENIKITKTVSIYGESIANVIISNAEWGDTISVMSPGVIIQNLTISNNPSGDGVGAAILDESTNSIYKNLHIYNNTYGIYSTSDFIEAKSAILDESTNSIYKNLHIYNNTYGIYLTSNTTSRVITNNFIQNNNIGIYYWYSGSNLIYNNYFDNIRNSEIHSDDEIINYWNISKTPGINIIGGPNLGGNYWSDYTEMDLDGDGFGESSYLVDDLDIFIDYLPLTDNVNLPPILGNPKPSDSSSYNPLELDWSIQINDSKGGIFDWNIICSNGQTSHSFESSNGTKTLHLSSLSYSTTYTIWVNVFDYYRWTNETFTFTTKGKNIIQNIPPVAIINGIFIGFPVESINFDGSQSYDSDGYITIYTWNLDDGTVLNGKNINHSYSKQGIYNVTLTVFDNKGAKNTTRTNVIIIKANNPPELNLTIDNSTGNLTVNLTITVIDKDGDNISCIINWDDDTSPTFFELYNNQTITKTHIYDSYGTYEIHVTADDGSTITSESRSLTLSKDNNKEEKNNSKGKGNTTSNVFLDIIENNEPFDEPFLDNQIDSRSILGDHLDKNYAKILATILSIILLFLLNYLIEFFSDYSSERTIEYRKNKKSKSMSKKAKIVQPSKFLSIKEMFAIIASTLILSFVLTWTWAPDLSIFWETFIIFLLVVMMITLIREGLRAFVCSKLKFLSDYYVWPLGAIMMFVSTAIGNTFSLAANHHYDEKDIKKCGKVSFIVSIVLYVIVAIAFLINLFYPSTILQMIIIVTILNLFIDLFPLNPMDGYEIRHWSIFLWFSLYIIVLISYITVYFNLYP